MPVGRTNRRAFIAALGSAAGWPMVARGQQPAMPTVGFLGAPSAVAYARYVAAIQQGLKEAGFTEGRNVRFEYRWAEGHYDRLPGLASDLVNRHVAVIVPVGGAPATVSAKSATSAIPIVFNMLADPVELGLVASLDRPGGNLTGVAMLGVELEAKRLELLREAVPMAQLIAVLVNPTNAHAESQIREVESAAHASSQQIIILNASTEGEIEKAIKVAVEQKAGALLVGSDTFFTSEPTFFVLLTARHALPAIYPWRSHADAGGLMSYGASLVDAYRQAGVYAGKILDGTKPAELPIQQPTKFELVINTKAAKALGLTIPTTLLARADEVIE